MTTPQNPAAEPATPVPATVAEKLVKPVEATPESTQPAAVTTTSSITPALVETPAVTSAATPAPPAYPVQSASGAVVTSISPETVPLNEESSVTITGSKLAGATVEFQRSKQETTQGRILENADDKILFLRTPSEAPLAGKWDIVIKLPDGSVLTLPEGLDVTE